MIVTAYKLQIFTNQTDNQTVETLLAHVPRFPHTKKSWSLPANVPRHLKLNLNLKLSLETLFKPKSFFTKG